MPFTFDPASGRYRDASGALIPEAGVRRVLDQVLTGSAQTMRGLSQSLIDGSLPLATWQAQMMQEVKNAHLVASSLGHGGWQLMDQSSFGWTGQRIRSQYAYLRDFAADIASGRQPWNATIAARAELYAGAARATHRAAQARLAGKAGMTLEKNQLGAADHCAGCLAATSRGWQPIGSLVPCGSRNCLSRCHCYLTYRTRPAAPAEEPWAFADDAMRSDQRPAAARPGWEESLSDEQKAAVKRYTTGGYRDLNEALRNGTPLTAEQKELSRHLDSTIAAAGTFEKPVTVWRGIDMGGAGAPTGLELVMANDREALIRAKMADYAQATFKPGDVLQLGGYQSTSFEIMPALNASVSANSPGLIFEVRANRGAYLSSALSNFDDEAELLLGHDTRYRVVGVVREVGFESLDGSSWQRTVVKLEQVGNAATS